MKNQEIEMSQVIKTKKRRFQSNNDQDLKKRDRNGSNDKKKEKEGPPLSND
jgi:hypothetical protein